MSIEMGPLLAGRLVYDAPVAALDDVRFERIIRGFAQHYEVTTSSGTKFSFARGEGYLRLDRLDAFGSVDGGSVERLRRSREADFGGNVVPLQPQFANLRFTLTIRVILIFWAATALFGWMLFGGDWIFWIAGLCLAYAATIKLIQYSLRQKLTRWLARESWH
jgi:hypothetical protein